MIPVEKALLTIAFSNFIVLSFNAQIVKSDLPTKSLIGIWIPSSANVTNVSPVKQPDSLKSDNIGRLLVLASTPRLNCDKAIMGTDNSLAKPFKERVILDNSWTRLSLLPSINCK